MKEFFEKLVRENFRNGVMRPCCSFSFYKNIEIL